MERIHDLMGDDEMIVVDVIIIDDFDCHMLPVLSERHALFIVKP